MFLGKERRDTDPAQPRKNFTVNVGVPEPSTWALALGFGLLAGAGYWTQRRSVSIPA